MATIRTLEELKIWQDARDICKDIYRITRYDEFAKDYRFVAQIRAAAGSIMDNIAEGFGREGNKEFIQFLSIAMGSVAEVKSQLYRASDVGYISQEEFLTLRSKLENTGVRITNFVSVLKKSSIKGAKYS